MSKTQEHALELGTLHHRLAQRLAGDAVSRSGNLHVYGVRGAVRAHVLAIMLGVRRAGVTTAVNTLVDRGLIQTRRRMIRIADREGLKKASNGAYGPPELELEKMFGGKS